MIEQRDDETRAAYLMRVASAYISDHPDHAIQYDEATCDGYCLSEELAIEADNMPIKQ